MVEKREVERGRLGSPVVVVKKASGETEVKGGSEQAQQRVRARLAAGQTPEQATRGGGARRPGEAQRPTIQQERRSTAPTVEELQQIRRQQEERRQQQIRQAQIEQTQRAQQEQRRERVLKASVAPDLGPERFTTFAISQRLPTGGDVQQKTFDTKQTQIVSLGVPVADEKQIRQIREQVGEKGKLVRDQAGNVALQFDTRQNLAQRNIKVDTREQIQKDIREQDERKRAIEIFQNASPAQKKSISLAAGLTRGVSGKGFDALKDGNKKKELIIESIIARERAKGAAGFAGAVVSDIGTSLFEGVGVVAAAPGIGVAARAVGKKIAARSVKAAALGRALTTKKAAAVSTAVIVGLETVKVKGLQRAGATRAFITGELTRDVIFVGGFAKGLAGRPGVRPKPPTTREIIGGRTREIKATVALRKTPGAKTAAKKEISIIQTQGPGARSKKELIDVATKGKVVGKLPTGETIRRLGKIEVLTSDTPTGLPRATGGDIIDDITATRQFRSRTVVTGRDTALGIDFTAEQTAFVPVKRITPGAPKPKGAPKAKKRPRDVVEDFLGSRKGIGTVPQPTKPRPRIVQRTVQPQDLLGAGFERAAIVTKIPQKVDPLLGVPAVAPTKIATGKRAQTFLDVDAVLGFTPQKPKQAQISVTQDILQETTPKQKTRQTTKQRPKIVEDVLLGETTTVGPPVGTPVIGPPVGGLPLGGFDILGGTGAKKKKGKRKAKATPDFIGEIIGTKVQRKRKRFTGLEIRGGF